MNVQDQTPEAIALMLKGFRDYFREQGKNEEEIEAKVKAFLAS